MHWLTHFFGLDSGSGPAYLWWSGAGSDLAYLGAGYALLRHVNCHERGCWRIGRFTRTDDGGHAWKLCRRHTSHPAAK